MSKRPLSGFRLWSTRPAGRGAPGIEALRAAGAEVIERPAIGFEPPDEATLAAARQLWDDPRGWDWRIFPSAAPLVVTGDWSCTHRPGVGRLAAVGAASAVAVGDALGAPCLAGPGTAGAAGLLALPEFSAAAIRNRRVLLVQGTGGRELLEATLRERGAEVAVARVYRRVALPLGLTNDDWPTGLPHALTLSSADIASAVAQAASAAGAGWTHEIGVLGWSQRILEAAQACGFRGPSECLAPGSGEEGLVEACRRLLARLS